jgi:hypothetical protein
LRLSSVSVHLSFSGRMMYKREPWERATSSRSIE